MKRTDQITQEAFHRYGKASLYELTQVEIFCAGARYADRTLTDKAAEWLINASNDGMIDLRNYEEFEREFRKAMRG